MPSAIPRSNETAHPSDASLARIDGAVPRIQPEDESLRDWCQQYLKNHRRRLAFDLDLLARFAKPGCSVLEVGSTPLGMTVALADSGYSVVGLDLAPERFAASIEANGLDVRHCDIENQPIPSDDNQFDVVLFNEVFEHLRINLIATFEEVHRVLKPGGILMLSTPNLRSADGLSNLLFRDLGHACQRGVFDQYSKLRSLGHMGHVREYTRTEVVEFLEKMNFAAEHLVYRGAGSSRLTRLAGRVRPHLKPFFTCLARKPVA